MGLCEVKWIGSGKITTQGTTIIYSGNSKHENDIAVIIDEKLSDHISGYITFSERLLFVKIKTKQFLLALIQVYAPTATSKEKELEKLYDDKTNKLCKGE